MKLLNLYRIIAAAHLTHSIDAVPDAFSQRGGIMLVAPPEQMKSTAISCLEEYGDCLVLSDLNVQQLAKHLRDQISSGRYNTLALPAFEKLYKRDSDTASNLEAHLCAMTEEGFKHASFEDSRTFMREAKCLVVGAVVESFYRKMYGAWIDSGFARRFLWCHFRLKDPDVLMRSIINWQPIVIGDNGHLPVLPYGKIPWSVTSEELRVLAKLIFTQPGKTTPHILAAKILCVLKWYFRKHDNPAGEAMNVFRDFAPCLNLKRGALIEFEDESSLPKKVPK